MKSINKIFFGSFFSKTNSQKEEEVVKSIFKYLPSDSHNILKKCLEDFSFESDNSKKLIKNDLNSKKDYSYRNYENLIDKISKIKDKSVKNSKGKTEIFSKIQEHLAEKKGKKLQDDIFNLPDAPNHKPAIISKTSISESKVNKNSDVTSTPTNNLSVSDAVKTGNADLVVEAATREYWQNKLPNVPSNKPEIKVDASGQNKSDWQNKFPKKQKPQTLDEAFKNNKSTVDDIMSAAREEQRVANLQKTLSNLPDPDPNSLPTSENIVKSSESGLKEAFKSNSIDKIISASSKLAKAQKSHDKNTKQYEKYKRNNFADLPEAPSGNNRTR